MTLFLRKHKDSSRTKRDEPDSKQVESSEQPAAEDEQKEDETTANVDGRVLIDTYPVYEPYVSIAISLEADGSNRYIVIEPALTESDSKMLKQVTEALKAGLKLNVESLKDDGAHVYLLRETQTIMKRFKINPDDDTFRKLFYFIERDFLNYGAIDPIMRDAKIEDISCNGANLPIYVFHRQYESLQTNIVFRTQEELDRFIMRMAYMSGRNISIAEPVVDSSMPDGSRLQMTFGSEITKKGSTFTIRKFREDPYSITDLIKFGTISAEMAATLWYVMESKGSVLLAGGTASGKTTSINCFALFIRPEAKIVTIEDTPEINIASPNWIQMVSRKGLAGMGEVSLYDLLKAALRQRPEFIIVGEVRGEEAQTMFQAISTGHAGMSSIHADSVSAVFHRLTNPPMDIPRSLIPAINFVILQSRTNVKGKPARRILSVTEVVDIDSRTNEIITNELYRYVPEKDAFTTSARSYILERLAKSRGIPYEEVRSEVATRTQILQWMLARDLRKYKDVAEVVQRYYTDKAGLLVQIGAMAP